MTPMQQLKNQFDSFKQIMIEKGFEELSLNKSSPKAFYRYWDGEKSGWEDKGVKADFVKLFKIKLNKEADYSIGFTFSYLDVPSETVTVSFKQGDIYLKSVDFNVDDFKNSFKDFIEDIKASDYKETLDKVKKHFSLNAPAKTKKIRI